MTWQSGLSDHQKYYFSQVLSVGKVDYGGESPQTRRQGPDRASLGQVEVEREYKAMEEAAHTDVSPEGQIRWWIGPKVTVGEPLGPTSGRVSEAEQKCTNMKKISNHKQL